MANLTIIKEVYLYTALTETAGDQFLAHKALVAANIPFTVLAYNDHTAGQQATLAALSTWVWGTNTAATIEHTTFPIVTWKECFDDYSTQVHCAIGSKALLKSTLLKNKALVQ